MIEEIGPRERFAFFQDRNHDLLMSGFPAFYELGMCNSVAWILVCQWAGVDQFARVSRAY